ncbi:hypothetical protein WMY93_001932 [Mugilogobius chulae]|uniref:CSD domain-containing protein n=1 Tax=Mugilogobius chulae TaxID=88201 RepID=A0AAW0PS84_9GOBI
MLPYTYICESSKVSYEISDLSTLCAALVEKVVTDIYLRALRDIATLTGKDFVEVLKSVMSLLGQLLTESQSPVTKDQLPMEEHKKPITPLPELDSTVQQPDALSVKSLPDVDDEMSCKKIAPPSTRDDEPRPERKVIATLIQGTVKWFNVKRRYGFIIRNDTKEDVFVHQTAIKKNNPRKSLRSVGDGEVVEFDVIEAAKGPEATNVTGPGGVPVKGSRYAPNRRRWRRQSFPRSPRLEDQPKSADGTKEDTMCEGTRPPPHRRRPSRRWSPNVDSVEQREVAEGDPRTERPRRRFWRPYRRRLRLHPPEEPSIAYPDVLNNVRSSEDDRSEVRPLQVGPVPFQFGSVDPDETSDVESVSCATDLMPVLAAHLEQPVLETEVFLPDCEKSSAMPEVFDAIDPSSSSEEGDAAYEVSRESVEEIEMLRSPVCQCAVLCTSVNCLSISNLLL